MVLRQGFFRCVCLRRVSGPRDTDVSQGVVGEPTPGRVYSLLVSGHTECRSNVSETVRDDREGLPVREESVTDTQAALEGDGQTVPPSTRETWPELSLVVGSSDQV